jgi:tetratricopeptide (TPR) repeat protein
MILDHQKLEALTTAIVQRDPAAGQLADQFSQDQRDTLEFCATVGEAHASAGNWSEARQAIETIRAIDPQSVEPLVVEAAYERSQGRYGAALGLLERAIAREPKRSGLRYIAGLTAVEAAHKHFAGIEPGTFVPTDTETRN